MRKVLLILIMGVLGLSGVLRAQETTFSFDDGISAEWRIFQNDSDIYQWQTTEGNTVGYTGAGVFSWTFMSGDLYPDNYIVTTSTFSITEETVLTYWIKAYEPLSLYNNEYYSVVVSEDNSTWTDILSEAHKSDWTQKTINFKDYPDWIERTIYFGFRHHNCNGSSATGLVLDEVKLTGISGGSGSEPEPSIPSAPENLQTPTVSQNSVTLSWNAVSGATSYNVYDGDTKIYTTSGTSYTVTGLTAGTEYCYSVTAVNTAGESAKVEACATTESAAPAVPSAPTNVRMTANGLTSVTLSWDPVAGATKYNIYNTLGWYVTNTTNTSYTYNESLVKNTYCFQVAAANDSGTSDKVMACVTAGAEPEPEPEPDPGQTAFDDFVFGQEYRIKYAAPEVGIAVGTRLTVKDHNNHSSDAYGGIWLDAAELSSQIFVFEDAGDGNVYLRTADGYYVVCWERNVDAIDNLSALSGDGYSFAPFGQSGDGSQRTPFKLIDCGNGNFYIQISQDGHASDGKYFKAEYNSAGGGYYPYCNADLGGAGEWTLELVIRNVPDAPVLTATASSSSTIDLAWNEVAGATAYKVYGSSGLIAQVTDPSYQVTDLNHSTIYCFTVTAVNGDGESAKSNEACATTLLGFDVRATDNVTKATVDWDAPTGAAYYEISRKNIDANTTTTLNSSVATNLYDDNAWAGLPDGRYQYGVRAWMEEDYEMREDFLTGVPAGWAIYNYNGNSLGASSKYDWQYITNPDVNNYYAGASTMTIVNIGGSIMAGGTGRHYYLVTDVIDLSRVENVELEFRYNTPVFNKTYNELKVKVIPANLGQGNAKANGEYVWTGPSTDGYTSSGKIDLSAWDGQKVYIAFESNLNQGWTSICNILITGDVVGYWTGVSWSNILAKGGYEYIGEGDWYEASEWKGGVVCPATGNAKILGDATITSDVMANSIVIAEGASLTLESGTLTVLAEIGNADASAFVIHDGTQVFHNGSNAKATYKMHIENPDNWATSHKGGWQFIASPVKGYSTDLHEAQQQGGGDFDLYKYDGTKVNFEWVNYKQHTSPESNFFYPFDTELPSGFTHIDADGDGKTWGHNFDPDAEITVVDQTYRITEIESTGCLYSNSNRCQPNNYLVFPRALIFDGTVFSFETRSMFPREQMYIDSFEVLVATKENPAPSDFTRVGGPYIADRNERWDEYSIDLSAYANQYVYIAIHHNARNDLRSLLLFDNARLVSTFENFDENFVQGRGYLASYENGDTASFAGTLNHEQSFYFGAIDYLSGLHYENFHLIGNPFSFDMDWSKMEASGICANGYATMTSNGTYEYHTSGTIKVGDGFFVLTNAASPSMTYTHNSRSSGRNNENVNIFVRGRAGQDNVIIGLSDENNDAFPKLENFNEEVSEVYIYEDSTHFAIKNYNKDVKEVELKFVPKAMGNYTIDAVTEGSFKTVTLVDRFTGIETNLLMEGYKFSATSQDDPRRFVVRFAEGEYKNENSFVFQSGDDLIIDGTGTVQIIDVMGRVVYSDNVECTNKRINVGGLKKAAYMVRCIEGNQVKTQKIVVL